MDAGSLAKFIPGAAFISAGVYGVALLVLGPYGPTRPMPPVCPPEQVCVLVTGIDNDVNVGFGAGGEPFGVDIEDAVATRLVLWLERSAPQDVRVYAYKYPREIELPEPGVADTAERGARALERAHEIGQQYRASLVVVGRVSGESISIGFIDPNREVDRVRLGQYDMVSVQWPDAFAEDYAGALRAALAAAPAPTPIAARSAPAPASQRAAAPRPQLEELAPTAAPRSAEPPPPVTQRIATAPAPAQPEQSAAPPQRVTQPPPQQTTPTPVAVRQPTIQRARVRAPPTPAQLARVYPEDALRRGIQGRVDVVCRVGLDGRLRRCVVAREEPAGQGFAEAAVALAENHTTAFPQLTDNVPVDGAEIRVPYLFRVQDGD